MNQQHLNDQALIDHLYGIGSGQQHLIECSDCQERLDAMRASRREVEASYSAADEVSAAALAAQRRAIYAHIEAQRSGWWASSTRAWATAALAIALLGGGWAIQHDRHHFGSNRARTEAQSKISDAELADQVSQIADDAEPRAAAPLQALFED
jgi:hypothetical protein